MQAWLCFSFDDHHLSPVSALVSSHCLDNLVHGPGVRNATLVAHDVHLRKEDSVVTSCTLEPGCLGRTLLLVSPYHNHTLCPASLYSLLSSWTLHLPAQLISAEQREEVGPTRLPLSSQTRPPSAEALCRIPGVRLCRELGPTTWLQGGTSK